jgi:restriction system protein
MAKFNYTFDELMNPAFQALRNLGDSASIEEMKNEVVKILKLSPAEIDDIHRGSTTKLSYRLAWARNYLKNYGLIQNSSRGVWSLSPQGLKTQKVDKDEVLRVLKKLKPKVKEITPETEPEVLSNEITNELTWQEKLIDILQKIPPDKFEKLSQRLLRELGFNNVEVTGKSGDGGIDGKGIIRIAGVLAFQVVFQCKRFKGNVSPSVVRDFRGAMVGRADKGLIITTGNFSQQARLEAKREGAPPIDLVDGVDLVEKLKELGLGVEVEMVEKVSIKEDWFQNF